MRALGKVREAGRGFSSLPEQGPFSISPHVFGALLLPDGKRIGAPITLAEFPSTAFLSGGERTDGVARKGDLTRTYTYKG